MPPRRRLVEIASRHYRLTKALQIMAAEGLFSILDKLANALTLSVVRDTLYEALRILFSWIRASEVREENDQKVYVLDRIYKTEREKEFNLASLYFEPKGDFVEIVMNEREIPSQRDIEAFLKDLEEHGVEFSKVLAELAIGGRR